MTATRLLLFVLFAGVAVWRPATANAQRVSGQITDVTSNAPVAEVEVQATLDGTVIAHAVTDRSGRYVLALSREGPIVIRAGRLGYATVVSRPIQTRAGVTLTHNIEIPPLPIPADSIVVRSETRTERGQAAFQRRCSIGVGICLTPALIAERDAYRVTDFFRGVEGIAIRQATPQGEPAIVSMQGYGCMHVFLDHHVHPVKSYDRNRTLSGSILSGRGALQNSQSTRDAGLNVLDPATIKGIEIYRGFHEVPKELLRTLRGPSVFACGVAIVWTTTAW